jgi:hypothetical protein
MVPADTPELQTADKYAAETKANLFTAQTLYFYYRNGAALQGGATPTFLPLGNADASPGSSCVRNHALAPGSSCLREAYEGARH